MIGTRAARNRLCDAASDLPPLLPHSPTSSVHTARELLQLIIRLNLAAAEQQEPAELLVRAGA